MIEPGKADTKLVWTGSLLGRGLRLYGWKEGWFGGRRGRRRWDAVVACVRAREKESGDS